ncbi:MAG: DHH family phosphoesterase [Candidatus Omnitrophica bacterium]|nr:DHH family phosphoesterase [Candidatus Omnitrophota bacterium]
MLSAHISPEGDCIASALALDSLLGKIRKKSFVLCEDKIPEQLYFLDNGRWNTLKSNPSLLYSFDNSIVVDCPALDRIGKVKDVIETRKTFLINIDHHISNKNFGDINFVDSGAAATGELIYDLFQAFRVPLADDDLRNIYVSLSTDTGSFRYSNTTAKTHEIVADLLRHGLKTDKLNEQLYDSVPRRKVDLFRIFLARLEFDENGSIASAILRDEDLKATGCAKIDLEGFVEYLRSIIEVQVSFLICQQGVDSRISFRSKGSFDVNKLAGLFGGGGHAKAAGCTIHAPVEKAKKLILEQVRKLK